MRGNDEVIAVLQDVLCAELTAVNQYFIHARMCDNWGYKRLAEHIRKESIEEMHHAQEIIDRILYFDGAPNMQKYMKINVGKTVPEQFQFDLDV
jgi:bacterioferritin